MAVDIVRKPRTCQGFATGEQTIPVGNGPIRIMRIDLKQDADRLYIIRRMFNLAEKRAFAKRIKIARSVITEVENGSKIINLALARKIKKEFRLPLDWVLDAELEALSPKHRKMLQAALDSPEFSTEAA